jgi:hypothetical protein
MFDRSFTGSVGLFFVVEFKFAREGVLGLWEQVVTMSELRRQNTVEAI